MLCTVGDFCLYVEQDLNGLIAKVSDITRIVSDEERRAYRESYPIVAGMLDKAVRKKPSLADVHISTMQMLLEYKLPAASAWCDLVLLGNNEAGRPEVIVIELKNYQKNTSDCPGKYEGLMVHKDMVIKHPSDQVKGYTEYCRRFHSAVQDYGAEVNGCVYFTQPINLQPYEQSPNDKLTEEYPMYNTKTTDQLADYVCEKIDSGNEKFADSFINGFYKQDRNILRQVAKNLQAKTKVERPFVLLDEQRFGFNTVMNLLEQRVEDRQKEVIIVQGPPGSGKSAVAVNLWIEAVMKYTENEDYGNIVYVTTSSSQSDNWSSIFDTYGRTYHGSSLILKANDFNPGLNGTKMKNVLLPAMRKINPDYVSENNANSLKYEYYEDYLDYMIKHRMTKNYKNNLHFLSVVDEAHALINPAKEGFKTNKTAGWCFQMGPQAYHIIRESLISVFFTDGKQSFRDNESTSVDDIKSLAERLGAKVTEVSLEGMQFRCAGSTDYVDWVERLFTPFPIMNHAKWAKMFDIKVVDWPSDMEADLRTYLDRGEKSCRILSSYSRKWVSRKNLTREHEDLADHDFILEDKDGKKWKKYWNNPEGYQIFVQGTYDSKMYVDPLCEVGCPYVVRGFDYDHVGILWLDDLVWRNGHWMLSLTHMTETANESTRSDAKNEQKEAIRQKIIKGKMKDIDLIPTDDSRFPKAQVLYAALVQAYRIILTRAIKSVTLYISDLETREYVRSLLK